MKKLPREFAEEIKEEMQHASSEEELIKRAENGTGMARFVLGTMYEMGDEEENVPVNYGKALYWYKRSMEDPDMPAKDVCVIIAFLLKDNIGNK